jgi:hypothetical protein
MGELTVRSDRPAAGYHSAEEGQGHRSAAARKLDDANNVGLLASGDARHWGRRLQRADGGFVPKTTYCRLRQDDSAVAILDFLPPVFRRFADSGCSRSVILSYHYSTTNLHEFTTLSNLP